MGQSLASAIRDLQQFREDFLAGAYPQRSALGPGSISKNFIKSKSIIASMLDVSNLEAVSTQTGTLNVDGGITLATAGHIAAGQTAYGTGTGFWMEYNAGLPRFSIGGAGGSFTFDGSDVTASGSITAQSLTANGTGTIAGWTIDSSKFSRDQVGIGASGTYRIWSGNLASPSLANFSVDSSGNIKSAGGDIAGWTVDSAKLARDTGAVGIGASGGYRIWAGNATPGSAPFRVDSTGALVASSATITGAVTATSGSFTGSVTTSNLDANGGTMGGLTVDGLITVGQALALNTTGMVYTGTKSTYASTAAGFFLGYDAAAYKLNIGDANKYFKWTGTDVEVRGKVMWGSAGEHYLDSTRMHFESNGIDATFIEWKNAALTPKIEVSGYVASGGASWSLVDQYDTGKKGVVQALADSASSLVALQAQFASLSSYIRAYADATSQDVQAILGDGAGVSGFFVYNNTPVKVFGIASNGTILTNQVSTTTTVSTQYGRMPVYDTAGTLIGYVRVWNP